MTKWRGDIIQEFVEELPLRSALPIINAVRASDVYFTMLYAINVCGNDLLQASTFDWLKRQTTLIENLFCYTLLLAPDDYLRSIWRFEMNYPQIPTVSTFAVYFQAGLRLFSYNLFTFSLRNTQSCFLLAFIHSKLAQFDRFIMQLLEMTWRFVIFATRFSSDHQ